MGVESQSELRKRKEGGSQTNGTSSAVEGEDKAKDEQVTWGRTPDGTGTFVRGV